MIRTEDEMGNNRLNSRSEIEECRWRWLTSAPGIALLMFTLCWGPTVASAATVKMTFPTPEAAVDAFREAVMNSNGEGLLDLFGHEHRDELLGGDPAAVRQGLADLRAALEGGIVMSDDGADQRVLVIGRQGWPMPFPLVRGPDGWSFDVDAGLAEIENRRIGRDELAAIDLCRAYMDAQQEYAAADRDGDQVLEYAQKLESTSGTMDGLYWLAVAGENPSPLGPFAAEAEQYLSFRKAGEPYRGYYFRVLTEQGDNPPGGAYNYVINGNMIAGYGLLAWPSDYGHSGIMTFLCSHHGQVLEKDLGEDTQEAVAAITAYDPDGTWAEVAE
jgi:Protein of unknown function (DUF2950)